MNTRRCAPVTSLLAVLAITGVARTDQYVLDRVMCDMDPYDDLYDGTLESMMQLSLEVADEDIITDIDVHLDMSYTWIGDLVIKLESPSGRMVSLMSRPGFDEPADDGSGCCGDSSDLQFGRLYEYDDDAASSSETAGMEDDGCCVLPFRLYSSGFKEEFGLTTLEGEDPNGVWTMYVGQGAGGDTGIWDGFTLQINCDCAGEIDNDCAVGLSDLLALLAQWGAAGSADFDGDGIVGTSDLLALLANWGPCP